MAEKTEIKHKAAKGGPAHVMNKDCWCNPTVEYVPPRSRPKRG